MPLPPKAIEQLAREPVRTPGWSSRLLMFSGTIFLIALFVHIGLVFGYGPFLQSMVDKLDLQIQTFSQEIPFDDQAKIIAFYSQLANLKTLLDRHALASPLFDWLERSTHKNVTYTKFVLNVGGRELSLGGTAKSANDIAEQTGFLEQQAEVDRVNLNSMTLGNAGLWQFDLSVFLKPGIFKGASPETDGVTAATSTNQ